MKRTISLLLTALFVLAALASCTGNEMLGVWTGQRDGAAFEISFEENGVCGYKYLGRSYLGTWETAGGKLTVIADDAGVSLTFIDSAEYTVSGDTLTITENGKATVLTKMQ